MFIASLRISLRRTLQHVRLSLGIYIGLTLAVAVMATTVVYFEALRDIALARSLETVEPARLDVIIKASNRPVSEDNLSRLSETIQGTVVERIEPFTSAQYRSARSWTFLVDEPPPLIPLGECPCRPRGIASGPEDVPGTGADGTPDPRGEGALLACDCRRIAFETVPLFEQSVRPVRGAMPEVKTAPAPPGEVMVMQALLDAGTAELFGLEVGDSISAAPFWESDRDRVDVVVSGIYERVDRADPLWTVHDDEFPDGSVALEFARFIIPGETFNRALGPYFPNMGSVVAWHLDTNAGAIHATDTGTIRSGLLAAETILKPNLDGFQIVSDLDAHLADFETELFFNRIPMLIVLALVATVALYFAAMVAATLLAAQRPEIALMRSRGATRLQIFGVYSLESVVISGIALATGPLLSMGVVSLTGLLPAFADLNNGDSLPVQFTLKVFIAALIGAGFGLLALLVPAFRATGLSVLTERRSRSRPGRLNVIQRYYLDLGLLGLMAMLFWQLSRQGSFVATDVFGENSVNNLTLAVPALVLLIGSLALLRIFPLLADAAARTLGSRPFSPVTPSAVFLGVRQLSRNPAGQARISLLLVLTSALAMFAATFAVTLERSAEEQVLYRTGAEFRATNVIHRRGGRSISAQNEIAGVPGVGTVAGVLRTTGFPDSLAAATGERFDVLGVGTHNFGDVAWHREDFFGMSMTDLMREIRSERRPGIKLPDDARFVSALVKSPLRRPDVIIAARMSDQNGRFYTLPLGSLAPSAIDRNRFSCRPAAGSTEPDWCRVGSSIFPPLSPGLATLAPSMPVTLHSIGVLDPGGSLTAGTVLFDDIAVLNHIGENMLVIEDFAHLSGVRTLEPTADALGDTISILPSTGEDAQDGIAEFRWTDAGPREYRGLAFGSDAPELPAVVSSSLAETMATGLGGVVTARVEGARARFRIARIVDAFPTLGEGEPDFLVADLDLLRQQINLGQVSEDVQPGEFWISSDPDGEPLSAERIKQQLGGTPGANFFSLSSGPVIDRAAQVALIDLDPLVTTGWQALLLIAFATVLLVSTAGYAVHARSAMLQRRSEMAILRTMGISRLQVTILIGIEQVLVVSVAVAVGVFLGTQLGDTIFPFLATSGRSGAVMPPMVVEFNSREIVTVFGILAVVLAATLAGLIWSASRSAIHSIMRTGDG